MSTFVGSPERSENRSAEQRPEEAPRWETSVSFLARFGLAAVWIVSGLTKITDTTSVIKSVEAYELFSPPVATFIGVVLPPAEIALGVLIALGVFLRAFAGLSIAIFAAFIGGIISAWARGLTIDCGCFGVGGYDPTVTQADYLWTIIRDLFFIAMAWWTVKWPFRRFAIYV